MSLLVDRGLKQDDGIKKIPILIPSELRRNVEHKGELLHAAREAAAAQSGSLRVAADALDGAMYDMEHRTATEAAEHRAARHAYNLKLLLSYVGPVVALLVGMMVGLVVHNGVMTRRGRPHHLEFGHWCGFPFAFVGYLPEILFFLLVIERYIIMGDYELLMRACGFRQD